MELSCGSKSEKGALGKRKLLQARVTFPRGNQSSDQQGYLSLLDGATLQMHRRGGGGIDTHTHKSLDKPDKSEDKFGDFNHWEDCTFSFPSSQKEREGENHCEVSQQKTPPVLGGHMEAVHFALQSWERLGTTDVI